MLFTSLGRSELGKTVSGVSILSAALADGGTKDFPMGTPGWWQTYIYYPTALRIQIMHKSSLKISPLLGSFLFCTVMKPVQLVGYASYASLSAKLFLPDKKCT